MIEELIYYKIKSYKDFFAIILLNYNVRSEKNVLSENDTLSSIKID